jgi:hypothetical protein
MRSGQEEQNSICAARNRKLETELTKKKKTMNFFRLLLALWTAAVLSTCVPPIAVPPRTTPFSPTLFANPPPTSCVGRPTGLHNITIRGYSVVELWCQSNKAFLVLPPRTSNDTNYSEKDGLRSFFCAVRLDPSTLLVDVGDLTFADPIAPDRPVVFANAAECRGRSGVFSFFNVDLRGTVFQLASDTTVTTFGWTPSNSSTISEAYKILNARVYGFCGGSYLGPLTLVHYDRILVPREDVQEVYCQNLQWRLSLVLTLPNVVGAVLAPPCALPANLTGTLRCNATLRVSPPPLASSICSPLPATTPQPPTQQPTMTTRAMATTTTASITLPTTTAQMSTSSATAPTATGTATATSRTLPATPADSWSASTPISMITNLNSSAMLDDGDVGDNTGAIVGGVFGAVLMAAVVAVLAWFVIQALARHRSQRQHEAPSPSSTHDTDDDEPPFASASPEQPPVKLPGNSQYSNRQAIAPNHSSHYGVLSREEVGV